MQGQGGTDILTADGAVGTSGAPIRVWSLHLISGGTAGVVNLRNGTLVTDTIQATFTGAINLGVTVNFGSKGMLFPAGCFYDEDANVTSTAITFQKEI